MKKTKICDKPIALQASMCRGDSGPSSWVWPGSPAASRADRAVCAGSPASGGLSAGPSTFPEGGPFPELDREDQPEWLEDKCMVGGNGEALVGSLCWAGNSCPEERQEHMSLFY